MIMVFALILILVLDWLVVESKIVNFTPFSAKIDGILCESLVKLGRVFESLEFLEIRGRKGLKRI